MQIQEVLTSDSSNQEPPSRIKSEIKIPAKQQIGSSNSSPQTKTFRRKFYPKISNQDWNNWQWQIKNRISNLSQLQSILELSQEEINFFKNNQEKLPAGITPYYMSLLSSTNSQHALRRSVIPTALEFIQTPEESNDPLKEDEHSPVHGLIHRYPDRVLFLILDTCSTYCRYCTRSRVVGNGEIRPSVERLTKAIDYIREHTEIRDVLLSGGDPLMLDEERLEWILVNLRKIPHVEMIRIGTKMPTVLPQRITPSLVKMLKKYHPLWMSLHFTHPDECTPETYKACTMLADAGIPLGSQTVLLKDINDSVDTIKSLVHNLLKMRVRPYYLYQCDAISGASHFRTPIEKGLEIIQGLRGHTSGYSIPTFVIDTPGGKIPLMPNYVVEKDESNITLRNYQNNIYTYPNI